ncbi:MAG: energy transducer TonB [Polyangiales bacterium]
MTHPQPKVFEAILVRPPAWRRLVGSTLWVVTMYAGLAALLVAMSREVTHAPRKAKRELTVTLLDAPKLAKLRSLGTLGGGTSGESAPARSTDPVPQAIAARAPKPASASNSKLRPKDNAKSLPQDQPKANVGVQVQQEETKRAPASGGAEVEAKGASATAAVSAQGGANDGKGSSGGTGGAGLVGSGIGAGSGGGGAGSGAGARGGTASGDTQVLPFMDGMSRPALLSKVDPVYTREARDANVSGVILTKCVITTQGTLQRCRVVKGLAMMDQAVLAALAQWRYSPVIYQGKPVTVEYLIPVRLLGP